MRTNKNTSKIILATIVAILATTISYSTFKNMRSQMDEQQKLIEVMQKTTQMNNQKETYTYAVATADLKAGEIVSDENIDFKQFDFVNKEAFENRSDVVNKVLLRDIMTGETFTTSYIARVSNDNVSLRDGYRALSLPADSFQGRSANMIPGTFVDIYSASNDTNWTLEDVKIISFDSAKKSLIDSANISSDKTVTSILDANSITFEIPADEVSSLISNISKGKLVLVTRNPKDRQIVHKKAVMKEAPDPIPTITKLPKLPTNSASDDSASGLPQPIQPEAKPEKSVEVIEANVKSKVTFD